MLFGDTRAFIDIGQAAWQGSYTGLYPLPAVGLFALLCLIPDQIVIALIFSLSLICLVAMTKRSALAWMFFIPVLQSLAAGQLDIIAAWLIWHESPVSFALLTLKPQLFIAALPSLIRKPKLWKRTALWAALLWLPSFVVRPGWIAEWVRNIDDGRIAYGTNASAWAAPVILFVAVLVAFAVFKKFEFIPMAFNPGFRPYDYTLLIGKSLWLIPLSWLVLWLMWQLGSTWVWAMLPLVAK